MTASDPLQHLPPGSVSKILRERSDHFYSWHINIGDECLEFPMAAEAMAGCRQNGLALVC